MALEPALVNAAMMVVPHLARELAFSAHCRSQVLPPTVSRRHPRAPPRLRLPDRLGVTVRGCAAEGRQGGPTKRQRGRERMLHLDHGALSMRGIRRRRRDLPAGSWPPYVQGCLRTALRYRSLALAVSCAGTAFFAVAVWFARGGENLLGIGSTQAGLAFCGQLGASILLALDLRAAQREAGGGRSQLP